MELWLEPRGGAPAARRLLVVAPHPDDDVLGCGGTIVRARAAGAAVRVLYVTDGAASHAGSASHPPERLRDLREREALAGLAALGLEPRAAAFLREPDGALGADAGSEARIADAVRAEMLAFAPTDVLSPSAYDVHPDHVAVARAVRAALAAGAATVALYEYRIWGDPLEIARDAHVRRGVRVDVRTALPAKRAALAAHRSQLGEIVRDATRAFTLPPDLVARSLEPFESFVEIARPA